MKNIFFLFILFSLNFSNSQTISGIVVDSLSGNPIELATLTFAKSKYCIFSDSNGRFSFDKNQIKDSLLVSSIGYETRKIHLNKIKNTIEVKLVNQNIQLDEVYILNKKIKYSSSYNIKSELKKSQYLGFQFGTENCRLIENPKSKNGKLSSIYLDLGKSAKHAQGNKLWTLDYLATFSIKFYAYDSIKKRPSYEIYSKNIIVEPKNKTYKLKIEVDSLNIKFPKDGICIGVEIINTKYKNPKTTFAIIAPSLKFTEAEDQDKIKSWIRYRNEGPEFMPLGTRDKKGKYSRNNMLVIDASIKYEK